jgi:hypothetical protein
MIRRGSIGRAICWKRRWPRAGGNDVPTLLTRTRARFLFGEERARTDEAKVGAYARARE